MKEKIVTMEEALEEVFNLDNESLSNSVGVNYNTIASWRFNFRHNGMSHEKKIEILSRMGYQFNEQSKWKKQVK